MIKHISIAILAALMLWTPAQAAEFNIEWPNSEHPNVTFLIIKGNLELKDRGSFRTIVVEELLNAGEIAVKLDSPGGLVAVAIEIGETIHGEGWHTMVLGNTCASACAFIWLAGKTRWYNGTAHIGFHGSREPGSWERSQQGDDFIRNYLKHINVPDHIIAYALAAPPTEMRWLSKADIKALALTKPDNIDKDEFDRLMSLFEDLSKHLPKQ